MTAIKRIGEILLDLGLISETQLEGALLRQRSRGGRLGENLVATLAITQDELMRVLAQRTGVSETHLTGQEIDKSALDLLPREVAERFNVVPLEAPDDRTLMVACADPTDLEALDTIGFITDRRIVPFLAPFNEIQSAIRRYYLGIDLKGPVRSEFSKTMEASGHGRKRLGELLVEAGKIAPSQLLAALNRQRKWGGILGENLVAINALTEQELMRFLAQRIHVNEIDLNEVEPDPQVIKKCPRELCERYTIAPIRISGPNTLMVACSDPTDLNMIDQLAFVTGYTIKPVLASYGSILAYIGRHYLADQKGYSGLRSRHQAPPNFDMEHYGGHQAVEDPDIIIFGSQDE